ncbi:uncharacterized protein LOC132797564 [Drosophila nasuta]|uniref:uncharacterized protein LOC132797564 n=1 Tax=Drosophila nasuta TaxID=42062 RepID=UPI00295E529E|nr:uncharacterized protein LOC132797564 [Drosophila nasuta]
MSNRYETPVVEKVAVEVDNVKTDKEAVAVEDAAAAVETSTTTENGAAAEEDSSSSADGAKENGTETSAESAPAAEDAVEAEKKAEVPVAAEEPVADDKTSEPKTVSEEAPAVVENGADETEVANGDSKDNTPAAEAVKRKVDETTAKSDEVIATPEKKAKLDDAASTKDEVQNGTEASEVAA